MPRGIESDEELGRAAALLEQLDFAEHDLGPEKLALQKLLARLIEDYDSSRHPPCPRCRPRLLWRCSWSNRDCAKQTWPS